MALGRDFTLTPLAAEGYDAVFLASAPRSGARLGIPGEDGRGRHRRPLLPPHVQPPRLGAPVGKNVVVIGGGNSAIDAARTALRLGAEEVTVVYRRSRGPDAGLRGGDRGGRARGRRSADRSTAPVEIVRDATARVTGVQVLPMALGEFDRSGRRRPEAGGDATSSSRPTR